MDVDPQNYRNFQTATFLG